ncbi:reverse transcriptase domain-containing protein [Tanacetum coccineum]|uniref:Reverse transcriptase domain-containing protein n=1 Tax=Tanacetum coccineum TaxID=301880 RepID=A0ABQ5H6Q0_9ASTR
MLKFPIPGGIVTLRSSRIIPLECTMVSGPEARPFGIIQATKERIKVAIHPEHPEQTIAIGSTLTEEGRKALSEHRLNVREECSPVRQKKRSQAPERNKSIQEEVKKLVDAGIMKEVHYYSWLSNPVMVKKHDDSWRIMPKTYQRLVDKAFQKQIGINLEVYVDELVIKSRTEHEIIRDIEETFKTLREINTKQNRKKCTFGIEEGMFLGYKVNTKGIKVCPDKVEAVLSLQSLKCLKDVQKMNGKLASLNRFLSKSAEKSLPFFKTLKKCTKKSDFQWTAEAKDAFKKMKQLIAELPTLTAPMEKEELIVYLAEAREAVNAVLMTEREAKQMPVYFASRALQGPEINYTSMEKPRTSVKGKILADFIVERPEDDFPDTPMEAEEELPDPWILFTDGSSCVDGSGASLILTDPEGGEFTYALRFRFEATNNEAEYEALIAAKEPVMVLYIEKVKTLFGGFKKFSIKQVPRSENKKGDALSKIASTSFTHLNKQALVEELSEKSINVVEVLTVVEEEGDTWMTPIYKYLTEETLPAEKEKARAIRRKSRRYVVVNVILYKKSYLGPWLRCVGPLQANYVLREIHEGSCSMHAETRFVVAKAIRTGYYWPTMHADARKLIRECQDCQVHRPVPRNPQQKLTPIMSPWPFYKWGIDIAGPFSEGPGKVKFSLPGEIISDNEKQFRENPFKDYLGEGIKARLNERSKDWIEEVPHVLWAHRTMIKSSNGDTPFSLTYITKAVILAEIGMPTLRTAEIDMVQNDEALEINLDLLEERREQATIHEARSKAKIEKYYNSKVRNTSFRPEDLVYRNNDASYAKDSEKLSPK